MKKNILMIVICLYSTALIGIKRAIVIGASAGMGREVAKRLSHDGYVVGLAARRLPLLQNLHESLPNKTVIKQLDVTAHDARSQLQELINELGGLDLMVISISAYFDNRNNPDDEWKNKERMLDVDYKGFIAMADVAIEVFKQQGYGHLVGVSSTSGLRGVWYNPVYAGAKAGISYYMEGVRNYLIQNYYSNIFVTDIVPGYVAVEHSPMGSDEAAYWEISAEQAGKHIIDAIKAKKKVAYIPPKVWWIALMLKYLPDVLYNNFFPWI